MNGEGAAHLGEADGRHRWRVTVWMPLGRGRLKEYLVTTRALPGGKVEVTGPNGKRRRFATDATTCCGCWSGDCHHIRALRAHVELAAGPGAS